MHFLPCLTLYYHVTWIYRFNESNQKYWAMWINIPIVINVNLIKAGSFSHL